MIISQQIKIQYLNMQRIYLVLFLLPLTALAGNHLREEIINYVIDPCFITLAGDHDEITQFMSAKEAAEIIKSMQPENVENMVQATLGVVKKINNFEQRVTVYELFRDTCITSGRGAK